MAVARRPLAEYLEEANRMIADDEGELLLPETAFLTCRKTRVTAATFADYYTDNPKHNTLNLLPSIFTPVLTVAGALDPDAHDLSAQLATAAPQASQSVSLVDGADRIFSGPLLREPVDPGLDFTDRIGVAMVMFQAAARICAAAVQAIAEINCQTVLAALRQQLLQRTDKRCAIVGQAVMHQ